MQTTPAGPTTAHRWLEVGMSAATASDDAAREAVEAATQGRAPALVMIFTAPRHDLALVAGTVGAMLDDAVPVIGCTTSGEIALGESSSGRLVAIALGGAGLQVQTRVGMLADGAREAGRSAAQGLDELDSPHRALLLLCDGLAGGKADLVRGAYSVAGAGVPLVGGSAGDDLAMQETFQLYRGEVLTGAVVGAAIGSDAPIGVGIGHGWRRTGEPVVVTESDGDWIFRLDDEPALDAYLRRVGASPEVFVDETQWQYKLLRHPFGLPRPGGEEVRAVLGANYENRSLFCGDVPQGTIISIMEGDVESVLTGTRDACRDALGALGGAAPVGVIAFDCAARRAILGDDGVEREMEIIDEVAHAVPLAGFYTYGEIARTQGSRGVHNATLVLLALA